MLEIMQFGWEIFTLSPVAKITVHPKKMGGELLHLCSSLLEREINVSREKRGYHKSAETLQYPGNLSIFNTETPCNVSV